MENRAYAVAFMLVLGIICLGAYVAVSALLDTGGDPIVRFDSGSPTATPLPVVTRAGTRTSTPTNTPIVPIIPTIIFPTITPVPPTRTPTLPPFPSAAVLPTRTPTPTDTPPPTATARASATTAATPGAPSQPTSTPVVNPGAFPYRVDSGPAVDPTRCSRGVYIYGFVRDAQNNSLSGVRYRYGIANMFTNTGVTEAKGYEIPNVNPGSRWFVQLVDAGDRPISPSVDVQVPPEGNDCWVKLDWRRN